MNPSIKNYLNRILPEKFLADNSETRYSSIDGGCINETYKIAIHNSSKFFLKVNSAIQFPGLFEKEKNGLGLLASKNLIRVPKVFIYDRIGQQQILLLEWIEGGLRTKEFWRKFGEDLARLHDETWSDPDSQAMFGLNEDNYMGSLIQTNTPYNNWPDFFINCRLQPQIKLAAEKNWLHAKHLTAFENLFPKLSSIFNEENSSLLHGDLWSGNFMCDENSEPILIDPAVYYGHRSVDLGMTTLFGGFDKEFYDAYNYYHPFPKNFHEQWDVANLYPLLIHLNLFGSGYLSQIETLLKKYN
jgi:fructosamine-3-kinase